MAHNAYFVELGHIQMRVVLLMYQVANFVHRGQSVKVQEASIVQSAQPAMHLLKREVPAVQFVMKDFIQMGIRTWHVWDVKQEPLQTAPQCLIAKNAQQALLL